MWYSDDDYYSEPWESDGYTYRYTDDGGGVFYGSPDCVWCVSPNADESEVSDPGKQLCQDHLNEYEGTSENGYRAMLAGERYDME
jgi:hypothetical protein